MKLALVLTVLLSLALFSSALSIEPRGKGKPKRVFGKKLPADKTGWVEDGNGMTMASGSKKYAGVDPKTGKKRQPIGGSCKGKLFREHIIADGDECCMASLPFYVYCRLYKKEA